MRKCWKYMKTAEASTFFRVKNICQRMKWILQKRVDGEKVANETLMCFDLLQFFQLSPLDSFMNIRNYLCRRYSSVVTGKSSAGKWRFTCEMYRPFVNGPDGEVKNWNVRKLTPEMETSWLWRRKLLRRNINHWRNFLFIHLSSLLEILGS